MCGGACGRRRGRAPAPAACRDRDGPRAGPTGPHARRRPRAPRAQPSGDGAAEAREVAKGGRRVPVREPLRRRWIGRRGGERALEVAPEGDGVVRLDLHPHQEAVEGRHRRRRSRGSRARWPRRASSPIPRTGRRRRLRARGCGEAASRPAAARTCPGTGAGGGRASSAAAAAGRAPTTRARGRSRRRAPPACGRTRGSRYRPSRTARRVRLNGGGRIRTCDLELRRLSLCPLSYAPRGAGFVPAGGVSVSFWRGRS